MSAAVSVARAPFDTREAHLRNLRYTLRRRFPRARISAWAADNGNAVDIHLAPLDWVRVHRRAEDPGLLQQASRAILDLLYPQGRAQP